MKDVIWHHITAAAKLVTMWLWEHVQLIVRDIHVRATSRGSLLQG